MAYNGARIALQFASSFFSLPSTRPFRYAEPFRGIAQATTLQLNSLLAMTGCAADPPADFAAMVALATELQRRSYLPPLRSLAKVADPAKAGLTLDPAEATAMVQAATYARASALAPELVSALADKLETPLRTGSAPPPAACQAAAAAIDALLAGRATGGRSACRIGPRSDRRREATDASGRRHGRRRSGDAITRQAGGGTGARHRPDATRPVGWRRRPRVR